MHVAMVMTLNSNNPQAHALIYCHLDYLVCCDNIGHVPVDKEVSAIRRFLNRIKQLVHSALSVIR